MCHLYIKTYSVVLIKVPNWHKIIKKKKEASNIVYSRIRTHDL